MRFFVSGFGIGTTSNSTTSRPERRDTSTGVRIPPPPIPHSTRDNMTKGPETSAEDSKMEDVFVFDGEDSRRERHLSGF